MRKLDRKEFLQRNPAGDRLFGRLTAMDAAGKYEDAFLEALIFYQQIYPYSEKFNIFFAKYALSHKNYVVALEYAEKAFAVRRIDFEVWRILSACHWALGHTALAVYFDGLCRKFYDEPLHLNIREDEVQICEKMLSLGMGVGNYAPFQRNAMKLDGKVAQGVGTFAGEYLPRIYPRAEYDYWVGAYTEQEFLDAKGSLLETNQSLESFVLSCGADFVFDIMRSKTCQDIEIDPGQENLIVPVAGTMPTQKLEFESAGVKGFAWLGKWAFSFFRIDEAVHLASDHAFQLGRPIQTGHSPKRKKLILNILVDALSWSAVRDRQYQDVPNIKRFFNQGVIFNQNFSVGEYTYPSLPTIETGMFQQHSQLFNENANVEMSLSYPVLSEQMKALGYYCVNIMGSGDGIYNGSTRGYDRLIDNSYATHAYVGVERTIQQLEAFHDCDQFLFLHVMDVHPWKANLVDVPLATQTGLSLKERLDGMAFEGASVYIGKTALHESSVQEGIRNTDRSLGVLFDYLQEHYAEDEYIVNLYSDHGVSVYDSEPYLMSEHHLGAALMVRGAGIPACGIVDDELTSVLDIYPILAHEAGFDVPDFCDGTLPAALGGEGHDYVISQSLFPGQTYKLCIRTAAHEFLLESIEPVDEDGTTDLSSADMGIVTRTGAREPVVDNQVWCDFLAVARAHTRQIHNDGHHWPAMRQARPEWYDGRKKEKE